MRDTRQVEAVGDQPLPQHGVGAGIDDRPAALKRPAELANRHVGLSGTDLSDDIVERCGGSVEHRLDPKRRGDAVGQFHVYAIVPRSVGREERIGSEDRHCDAQGIAARDRLWGVLRLLSWSVGRPGLRDQQPAAPGRKQCTTCNRHTRSQLDRESQQDAQPTLNKRIYYTGLFYVSDKQLRATKY